MSTVTEFSQTIMISFLLLITSSLPFTSSQPCNKQDMHTLLSIKNSLGNPSGLSSWYSANAAVCCSSWRGVGCHTDGRIQSIGIFQTNVSGPIPSSLANLPALKIINFYDLPNLTSPIPPSITNLTSLTQLIISKTGLSGKIPSFFCNLADLDYLDLAENKLTGHIPPCLLGDARSFLPSLKLYGNQLTGQIPRSFEHINFGIIDLSRNKLTGDPSFVFKVHNKSSVKEINLSWNEFTFDLSRVRFPLSLTDLDLSHNKIRGTIPQQITTLKKLSFVDFSYNMLCGAIPKITAFSLVPAVFEHNKCLCGAPLSPCKRSRRL